MTIFILQTTKYISVFIFIYLYLGIYFFYLFLFSIFHTGRCWVDLLYCGSLQEFFLLRDVLAKYTIHEFFVEAEYPLVRIKKNTRSAGNKSILFFSFLPILTVYFSIYTNSFTVFPRAVFGVLSDWPTSLHLLVNLSQETKRYEAKIKLYKIKRPNDSIYIFYT